MLSGLASVGLHQAFHQFLKEETLDEMTDEDALLAIEESEYLQQALAGYKESDVEEDE